MWRRVLLSAASWPPVQVGGGFAWRASCTCMNTFACQSVAVKRDATRRRHCLFFFPDKWSPLWEHRHGFVRSRWEGAWIIIIIVERTALSKLFRFYARIAEKKQKKLIFLSHEDAGLSIFMRCFFHRICNNLVAVLEQDNRGRQILFTNNKTYAKAVLKLPSQKT